ncbi:uncharacterized protein LOC111638594 isoform X3 [Centruroides sculpturatus]|uniref:uncharacterized protein LOC111638594 isoform X2 n=1 Tax=Centruroides sculpturatus TaxID=218467 RepID=UPI000C6D52FB|nr:uncharacterized protein LOC111638594 isoform X2 [Centruroides sculpturatus]XP_023240100.1 uncharacterized protein LOC111638594 isoform X3 [Centruroides sculpturatus]
MAFDFYYISEFVERDIRQFHLCRKIFLCSFDLNIQVKDRLLHEDIWRITHWNIHWRIFLREKELLDSGSQWFSFGLLYFN